MSTSFSSDSSASELEFEPPIMTASTVVDIGEVQVTGRLPDAVTDELYARLLSLMKAEAVESDAARPLQETGDLQAIRIDRAIDSEDRDRDETIQGSTIDGSKIDGSKIEKTVSRPPRLSDLRPDPQGWLLRLRDHYKTDNGRWPAIGRDPLGPFDGFPPRSDDDDESSDGDDDYREAEIRYYRGRRHDCCRVCAAYRTAYRRRAEPFYGYDDWTARP